MKEKKIQQFKKIKKAQEEMVGFGLIVIIIAVIMLVFLWFYFMKPAEPDLKDYEAENFVKTTLQYTTSCKERGQEYLDMRELISWCYDNSKECENGENSCEILRKTLDGILEESWSQEANSKIKGYSLNVSILDLEGEIKGRIYSKDNGNITGNLRGYTEEYSKKRTWIEISFLIYS